MRAALVFAVCLSRVRVWVSQSRRAPSLSWLDRLHNRRIRARCTAPLHTSRFHHTANTIKLYMSSHQFVFGAVLVLVRLQCVGTGCSVVGHPSQWPPLGASHAATEAILLYHSGNAGSTPTHLDLIICGDSIPIILCMYQHYVCTDGDCQE